MMSHLHCLPSIVPTSFSVSLFEFESRAMKTSPLLRPVGLALATASLLLLTTTSLASLAQEAPATRRSDRPERIFSQLNLNDEQIQQLRQIHERRRSSTRSLRDDLHQAEESLRALMVQTSTRTEIETQFERVQDLRQQVARSHFQIMLDMRDVLTPAQRQQFGQLMRDRRRFRGGRGG